MASPISSLPSRTFGCSGGRGNDPNAGRPAKKPRSVGGRKLLTFGAGFRSLLTCQNHLILAGWPEAFAGDSAQPSTRCSRVVTNVRLTPLKISSCYHAFSKARAPTPSSVPQVVVFSGKAFPQRYVQSGRVSTPITLKRAGAGDAPRLGSSGSGCLIAIGQQPFSRASRRVPGLARHKSLAGYSAQHLWRGFLVAVIVHRA
jgi:hypothetical protein